MEKSSQIRSVSRSISVLQAINRHGSLSAMEIAKHEDLPYPTAYRIIQTLVLSGLIELEPTRKHYRPTALVQSLAHGYRAEGRLVDSAADVIRDLTKDFGWPVFISERVGTRMVVRDATHAETSLTFSLCYPGFNIPLITSASGHAWLAQLSDAEIDRIIEWHSLSNGRRMARLEIDELKHRLGVTRREGYAAKPCQNNEPRRSESIAVPILHDGKINAVLTLIYFQSAMKQHTAVERYLLPLQRAAHRISEALDACPEDVMPPVTRRARPKLASI